MNVTLAVAFQVTLILQFALKVHERHIGRDNGVTLVFYAYVLLSRAADLMSVNAADCLDSLDQDVADPVQFCTAWK
ncbi:hypothetical protein P280DRAFT_471314 [Massarina eburnea CBS 473.64]|uniref:Uncharacterized protein n=1 Tax=Massarina eburnea CBS 473.64 TaxID=1395130 RepID=A0A6A6RT16_9PLEO|nr:hypothetical protein P280DRAFT_471314 [Massarina eburnea CBS 473.64]